MEEIVLPKGTAMDGSKMEGVKTAKDTKDKVKEKDSCQENMQQELQKMKMAMEETKNAAIKKSQA